MSILLRALLIAIGLIAFGIEFSAVMNRKLSERQSLIWFTTDALLVLCGIFPKLPVWVAGVLGVEYAPSAVFMLAILALIIGLFNCYSVNTELKNKVNELAIQVSLLNEEQREIKAAVFTENSEKVEERRMLEIKRKLARSKKILFVINTLGKAGAEMAMIELMKKMLREGYSVYLYVMIPIGEVADLIPPQVHIINSRLYNCSLHSARGKRLMSLFIIKCGLKKLYGIRLMPYMIKNMSLQKKNNGRVQFDKVLWRLISNAAPRSKMKYNLAIAYIEGASTYYVSDYVRANKKVSFVHIDYKEAGYLPYMDKQCYEQMERIFAVSDQAKNKFIEVYPDYEKKVDLFYNIIDENVIRAKAEAEGFTDEFDGTRIVSVGRLHYQKAYDIAIEACAKLKAQGRKVKWYVLGDGAEKKNLEELISKAGVEQEFILLGAKANPYPFVKQANLYVHATRYEGKSIAIEEAQVLGKTIIASDCTGNREQIEDGVTGKIVNLTAEEIAGAIGELIDNPQTAEMYAKNTATIEWNGEKDLWKLKRMMEDTE